MFNKTDLINFEYCPSLFLNEKEKTTETGISFELLKENGFIIENKIRKTFKGNTVYIPYDKNPHKMIEATRKALFDPNINTIFEATLSFNNIIARIDILDKCPDGKIKSIEIKSATRVDEHHIKEINVQSYVLSNNGIKADFYLYTVSKEDKRGFDVFQVIPEDIHELVQRFQKESHCPIKPELSFKCKGCDHFTKCFPEYQDKNTIFDIPRISEKSFKFSIDTNTFILNHDKSYNYLSSLQSGLLSKHFNDRFIHPDNIKAELPQDIVGFLDFETIYLPYAFGKFRSYEKIPVQYSYISLKGDKVDYIDDGAIDAERFILSLLATIPTQGKIAVYNVAFEKSILEYMTFHYPAYEKPIMDIISRLYDLLPLIRDNIYYKEMNFKFDLKTVSRTILNKNYYSSLIKKGDEAMAYFILAMVYKKMDNKNYIKEELVKYCSADTECLRDLYIYLLRYT